MSEFIRVTMVPQNLQIYPGDAAEVSITIQNCSNVVDSFLIEVQGLDSSWFKLSVLNSSLMPRDEGSSIITISPPKSSDAAARDYPITVRVISQKDPTQETNVTGNLEVQPFYTYSLDLRPQKMTGPKGSYSVIIANNGNAELDFALEGRDPEDLCQFRFDNRQPRVLPGETAEIPLDVEPGKRPIRGRPKPYNFTLTASPQRDVSEPKTVPGGLDVTPRIGEWLARTVGRVIRRPALPRLKLPRVGNRKILGAVIAAVCLLGVGILILVTRPSAGEYTGEFLIEPGSDASFAVPLAKSPPVKIMAQAEWQGAAGFLAVTLLKPDGDSVQTPVEVTRDASWVDFELDQDLTPLGVDGWVVNVKNTSARGQADGTIKLIFSDLD